MKDYEIKRYKRVHRYSNPSDVERGKIRKETKSYLELRTKSKKATRDMLRNIRSLSDVDESLYDEIEEISLKAKKEKNNAKAHKKRLNKLKDHEDFY